MTPTRLVWFRSDLRVHDNTALAEACQEFSGAVFGVFFATPEQWRQHDWGPVKQGFVLRCVAALQRELQELHIPLIVRSVPRFTDIPAALREFCVALGCTDVYANYEYELNERKRDEQVQEALQSIPGRLMLYHDQTCLPPNHPKLRTTTGGAYTVFTPFKKRFYRIVEGQGGISVRDVPELRNWPSKGENFSIESEPLQDFQHRDLLSDVWPGGEQHALSLLKKFTDNSGGITKYHEHRDIPSLHGGTSRLSPYLAIGAISPRLCFRAGVTANNGIVADAKNGPMTWVSEIIWREFYRHVLLFHERICKYQAFKENMDRVPWREDLSDFQRWTEGRTGYPLVDAAMRQLRATGWMHNRLRMVVASFLTKHLLINWRWGERYFMEMLIDGDFASNNGGWQWSASTGTDAQPYFRIFNPYSQSERFDPEGAFIRNFVPELKNVHGKDIHKPPLETCKSLGYPTPIVDHFEARERALETWGAVA
ncbi:MAG: deoxyribodipyrimidine photo-lyase [Bdellovibrionales bacterium]|nr:deoxyribodipyrimidine photo-lyase [Bdellovibrionales bacterium]